MGILFTNVAPLLLFSEMKCIGTLRLLLMLVGVGKQYMGFGFNFSWLPGYILTVFKIVLRYQPLTLPTRQGK